MVDDPAAGRVASDLAASAVLSGIAKGRWRIVRDNYPLLDFAIMATEPGGEAAEYFFRAELTNYPVQAPMVRIWSPDGSGPLSPQLRPKGGQRVTNCFQAWTEDTVYRPWDRKSGPHASNAASLTHLAWRPDRTLAYILEDLHGILNLNARTHRVRKAA